MSYKISWTTQIMKKQNKTKKKAEEVGDFGEDFQPAMWTVQYHSPDKVDDFIAWVLAQKGFDSAFLAELVREKFNVDSEKRKKVK